MTTDNGDPWLGDLVALRRDLHRHPETAFEEYRTAALVERELRDLGLEVISGIAGTGLVGTLRRGEGPAIGLRADLDALHLQERNTFDHRSRHDGKMHACGHDGHIVMLLGAARRLAMEDSFRGTVHFIFQPAEENEGGGRAMIEAGLFERFPVQSVYGMHNWPGIALGQFAICQGTIMAAFDTFEVRLRGAGTHAALPHLGNDCLLAASQLINNLQSIVSRGLNPQDAGVVSVTQLHGGDAWNVMPAEVVLRGCTRYFREEDGAFITEGIRRTVEHTACMHSVEAVLDYQPRYPATVNAAAETAQAIAAAQFVAGAAGVHTCFEPAMTSEDFAFMLQEKPGAYILLGNGPGEGGCLLHNPTYDFNDAAIAPGVEYWCALVRLVLPVAQPSRREGM